MINHQELKKKYSNIGSANSNTANNSLISAREFPKPNISREKSKKHLKEAFDDQPIKPSTFKTVRDNLPLKSEIPTKPRKEYSKQTMVSHEVNPGISINVNIQNLITPRNVPNLKTGPQEKEETTPKHSEVSNKDSKKVKKFSNLKPDPDSFEFQCTEELVYKKPEVVKQPLVQKQIIQQKPVNPKQYPKKKEKQKMIDPKELLKKFQAEMEEINGNNEYESLVYLDNRQQSYLIQPDYIQKKQKSLTWLMRAFLVEWIMQVCYEFAMKRETFHISVNIVDRYLEKETNLPKSQFQLVGLASMFIASKLEEFSPRPSQEFVKSANGSYTAKQIKQMERKIIKSLKYALNPPTLYRWGNRLMVQWDSFIKENSYAQKHPAAQAQDIFFKECDENSYVNYRQMMQMLDCSIMDVQTYEYNPKLLVFSFMYLIIGCRLKIFNTKEIVKQFPGSSRYLLDDDNVFNDLFGHFLEFTFNIQLIDILPVVQYSATYFILPQNVDKPMTPSQDSLETMQLEEYCSFQTYDRNMYIVIKKRARGVYI